MKSKLILSLAGVLMLCAQTAYAQEATDEQASSNPTTVACKADIDTLCKDTAEGRGKYKCLRENEAKVSAGCKTAMDAQKAAREAVKAACKTDRDTLCKDAGDERGAGMKCLRDNASKVSPDCGKALASLPQRNK